MLGTRIAKAPQRTQIFLTGGAVIGGFAAATSVMLAMSLWGVATAIPATVPAVAAIGLATFVGTEKLASP